MFRIKIRVKVVKVLSAVETEMCSANFDSA